ncbi:hypothetical protein LC55x_4112 [Lysobacter capsici]|nr:hypothetical protein LC55x_4112 [Lysobacter capsici]
MRRGVLGAGVVLCSNRDPLLDRGRVVCGRVDPAVMVAVAWCNPAALSIAAVGIAIAMAVGRTCHSRSHIAAL